MLLLLLACSASPGDTASSATCFSLPFQDAAAYYVAQGFGVNAHLGEDWNGDGGGDSDLGDPVFAVADGVVTEARDHGGGWGQVVRLKHELDDGSEVESLYAHLLEMTVGPDDPILRGQQLGTIGNADGRYLAHLHLEMRDQPGMPLGPGYSDKTAGYVDPRAFIAGHQCQNVSEAPNP